MQDFHYDLSASNLDPKAAHKSSAGDILSKLPPVLLAASIMNAFLYVYTEEYITVWGIVSTIFMAGCYAIFGELKKRKIVGSFLYAAMLFFVCIASGFIILSGPQYGYRFIVWFFSGTELEETSFAYLVPFTLLFSFIFISIVFYFTEAVYRKTWLLIVSLIPFTAYAKMLMVPPAGYIILIAGFELFIYLQKTRQNMGETGFIAGRKSVITVYGDFAIALVILIAIIPKPTETPYWEAFEGMLSRFTFGQFGTEEGGGKNNRSGNADDYNRGTRRLLYNLAMPERNYLKMQSYPYYNAEENFWYQREYAPENFAWDDNNDLLSLGEFAAAVLEADSYDPGLLAGYGLTGDREWFEQAAAGFENDETDIDPALMLYVEPANYPSVIAIAPNRPLYVDSGDTVINESATEMFGGGILSEQKPFPGDRGYTFGYRSDTAPAESGYLDTATAKLPYDMFGRLLLDIVEKLPVGSEHRLAAKAFNEQHNAAMDWRAYNTYQNSRIETLADTITDGAGNTYDKADALQKYFSEEGFEYILGYNAPVDTSEYFIFDSKIGTCSDFATAFTLLAGAEGLSVRYTEGFIPIEVTPDTNQPGVGLSVPVALGDKLFYITTENAHAYPEVYINGMWVRFEPTVASLTAGTTAAGTAGLTPEDTITILVYVLTAVACVAIAVIIILLMPAIREGAFRVSVSLPQKSSKIPLVMLYRRLLTLTGREKSTPSEFCDYAERVYSADVSAVTIPLEQAVFGDKAVDKAALKLAKQCYKGFYKVRKAKR
jgi:hypothetical protein